MLSASKVLAIAAILAADLTSAQTEGTLPACAQTCVSEYTSGSSIGGCSSIDIKCICSNSSFISGIACCLTAVCDAADQKSATNYALSFCSAAGVTNLPTAVSCTSTASSTAASVTSSSSSATGAVTTTSSTSSTASSVSSSLSSVSSSASSVSSSVSSSASQASSSTSSATSAATSATKNAGFHNVAGVGAGVLGGLAAAVAIL